MSLNNIEFIYTHILPFVTLLVGIYLVFFNKRALESQKKMYGKYQDSWNKSMSERLSKPDAKWLVVIIGIGFILGSLIQFFNW